MDRSSLPISLNEASLLEGISYLSKIDPDLALVVKRYGYPPQWAREPGYPTLIHIILEQQVSLASARAAFDKLNDTVDQLTPGRFLEISDRELKIIGYSWQKAHYCRELSEAILKGDLNLERLWELDDSSACAALMAIKGIGPWTADIYLLMALLRPDIWPSGDLALAKAAQEIKNLASIPSPELLYEIATPWRPWRAVAARILRHHYLS